MSTTTDEYDFVIIGGGTSGLVMATRLSEIPDQTVLILEDGPSPTSHAAWDVPGGNNMMLGE